VIEALPETGGVSPAPGTGALRASVVIPHLNNPGLLQACLGHVLAQRLDHGGFEVIVVDNGSTMPLDSVQQAFPQVRFLTEPTPGPGPARNLGAAAARAPVIAFLDADIRVAPGWLLEGVRAVEADPSRPVGGDVRIDFRDPARPTALEAYEAVFSFQQRRYIEEEGFSGTGNMMVARDLFGKIGPFEGIHVPEDILWGQKAARLGHRTRYLEAMRVYHPPQADLDGVMARWQRLIAQRHAAFVQEGRAGLGWQLHALKVLLSVPPHALRVLGSDRVHGLGARLGAIVMLARIRWLRFLEMQRVARAEGAAGATSWHRHG
jgi:hypothetical protein